MPPRYSPSRAVLGGAVALALAGVLAGCVPEPPSADPTSSLSASAPAPPGPSGVATSPTPSSPTPTATATPTTTPTARPTASPTVSPTAPTAPSDPDGVAIPGCASLLPLSTVRALFADAAERIDTGRSAADLMPGPLAAETAAGARQAEVCTWAVPFSDGGFSVVAAEITGGARDRLVAGLRGSSYRATTVDGATAFTRQDDSDFGTTAIVYVFDGNAWITVTGTLTVDTAREFAASALDAVRSAS